MVGPLRVFVMLFGIYLVADSFLFHALSFNYSTFSLQALDPYVQHWMVGIVFIILALVLPAGKALPI
mgnify:FL=1